MTDSALDTDFLPVLIGGDIGVYGIGRSFHEAYGCRCIAVASSPAAVISRSDFFDVEHIRPRADDDELLAVLIGIAAAFPKQRLVLMANHDLHSAFVARHYQTLSEYYALPFPDLETVEKITDKASFAHICETLNIPTPQTRRVDFSQCEDKTWEAPHIPFDFPVVAKAARGDAYDAVRFEGKRKIWFIESAEELQSLWETLRVSGFRDTFLVQELIPGDNTNMWSITAYADSHGDITLMGSARVLLEDHDPTMIGNPVAMITEPHEELWEDAQRILLSTHYRGFANFDVKIDPRDGRAIFFEVNPRIGRNNWYMTAGGVNPMSFMVDDLLFGKRKTPATLRERILYSLVPDFLLLHYIRDNKLKNEVTDLIKQGKRVNPLEYRKETDIRRKIIVALQKLNHHRKFRRYYPEANDQSF
ncbi:MAG: carboxylate--amine ligase [Actinobacteria bacterium]|nr:MAG: carboxylate--amine ligase [Actinomycetota bacterium]